MNTLSIDNLVFEQLLPEWKIQERIRELSHMLEKDYSNTVPIFICVLNGAFIFFSDLLKNITLQCEVDFLQLSSYKEDMVSSGQVSLTKGLNCSIAHRDIIVVEDIVDTGASVLFIKQLLEKEFPASLRFVSLLFKPYHTMPFPIDYIGFTIPEDFVIGYGLDYKQKYRNLPSIYRVQKIQ
jgi:hypoxanthine phosphoribosyltransferase